MRTLIAIDLRALAAFRIGIGLLLLIDLAWRAWEIPAFLTDEGVLPRVATMGMLGYSSDLLGLEHQWSLHLCSGQAWAQAVLLTVAAWSAVCLAVGLRTKWAAVASWLLLVSLDSRNPLVLDAGDTLLSAMLFWSLFTPLGARWSVDSLARSTPLRQDSEHSMASAALLLQLAVMYWASAYCKMNPVWTSEFSGVYYALRGDAFVTPIGLWLREHERLMQAATAGTICLEAFGPCLAFCPFANRGMRVIAFALFVSFHGSLALTMALGIFPWICAGCWLLILPPTVWDRLEQRAELPMSWMRIQATTWLSSVPRVEAPPSRIGTFARQITVGLVLVYVLAWNIRELMGPPGVERIMSHRFNGVAFALRLAQGWSMYAPIPRRENGWLVMRGTLRNGTEVNLWEPEKPLPWRKPALLSATYRSQRWRRYLENLPDAQYAFHRQYFADWLQREWNRCRTGGDATRDVAKVELLRQLEVTPPPGQPFPPVETVVLCERQYTLREAD